MAFTISIAKNQNLREIVITGKINGATSSIATVFKNDDYAYDERIRIASTTINDQTDFKIQFEAASPEIYDLQIDERVIQYPLYLSAGDSIHIQIDVVKQRWEYAFSGTAGNINRFEQEFYKAFPRDDEYENNRWRPKSFSQFRDYINARKENQFKFYHKFFRDNLLPDKFKTVFESKIIYNWAWDRADFLVDLYYIPEKPYVQFDSTFFSFENSISLSDSNVAYTSAYRFFLDRYIYLLAMVWKCSENKKGIFINDLALCKKKLEIAKSKFNGFNRDVAVAIAIGDILGKESPMFTALAKKTMEEFRSFASNKKYFDSFSKHVEKILSLSPGQPAPDFTAPDIDGNQITLSSYKGKIVYLDFWATWCAPCIEEMTHTIELQKKFSNDNIVYIFAALEEKNQKGWREFVQKKKFAGVHLYLEGRIENTIAKKYNIGGLPRFILIDQEGKIVSDTKGRFIADGQTQGEMEEKIRELLKKE